MRLHTMLTRLSATSSLKAKESILREYQDDELVKCYLQLALSPKVVFYIGKAPRQVSSGDTHSDAIVVRNLQNIASKAYRGQALLDYANEVALRYTEDAYYVFSRALEKDLDCNVGSTIVNKVWPKLIHDHPYMGAKSDTIANRKKLNIEKGAVAQEKCDGMYCDLVVNESGRTCFTRQGQLLNISNMVLDHEAKSLPYGVWQGELRVLDMDKDVFLPRHIGNGIIRHGLKGGTITLPHTEPLELIFTVWDYLHSEEQWQEGRSTVPYVERFNFLNQTIHNNLDGTCIRVVRTRSVDSWDRANEFYMSVLSTGGEGAIVKLLDAVWKDGKPSWQVKMKVEETCDMVVVGVVPHSKDEGRIGALEVASQGSTDVLEARCGGLMDEAMDQGADYWVGKVIRMKYNALSPYGRFDHPRVDNCTPPRPFACVRADGCKPNTAEEIRENYNRAVNPL